MHYTTKSVSADGLAFSIWPAYADGVATEKLDLNDSAEESAVVLWVARRSIRNAVQGTIHPPRALQTDYPNINAAGQQHQNSLRRLPHRMRRRSYQTGTAQKGHCLTLKAIKLVHLSSAPIRLSM